MRIYAHRGHGLSYPECTRLAYEKALDAGCDGLYVGVHPSKDGHWVVVNDGNLLRLTGQNAWVWEMACEQVTALEVRYPFPCNTGDCHLMELNDFLDLLVQRNTCVSIEMVTRMYGSQHPEVELAKLIQQRKLWDRVVLMGYDHEAVMRCREAVPQGQYGLGMFCQLHHLPEYLCLTGTQHLFLRSGYIQPPLVENLHSMGITIHAEYICTTAEAQRLQALGCDVINTPYPQLVADLSAGRSCIYGETLEEAMAKGSPLLNASMNGIDISQMRYKNNK